MKDSLCWKCKNALKGCSWSKNFIPVPGWKARPTELYYPKMINKKFVRGVDRSYHVESCPQYEYDGRTRPTAKELAKEQGVSTNDSAQACEHKKNKKGEYMKRIMNNKTDKIEAIKRDFTLECYKVVEGLVKCGYYPRETYDVLQSELCNAFEDMCKLFVHLNVGE